VLNSDRLLPQSQTFLNYGRKMFYNIGPRKKKWTTGWVETDLDSMVSIDRAGEVAEQLKKESGLKKSGAKGSQNLYVNTFEEEEHRYENFEAANPYEDDVQTVHSEGVRSEFDPPPLPTSKRPTNGVGGNDADDGDESPTTLTLGDISEADDRVKTVLFSSFST